MFCENPTALWIITLMFNIPIAHVCRDFICVNLVYQCLKPVLVWASKHVVKEMLPLSMSNYPNSRAIIDCTEYYVQTPLKHVAQRLTWS